MQMAGNQFIKASTGWPKYCYGVDLCSPKPVVVYAEKKRGRVYWNKVDINNTTLAKAVGNQTVTAACLSARESLTRRLEAPFSSRSKALRVFPTLLDIQLPFSIEDCQSEFFDYRRTNAGTMEALAVAATKENINSKVASVKEVGFDPEIIDVEGLASWSQILHETVSETDEDERLKAVLVLDGKKSSLTIGRGQSFLNSYGLHADDVKRVIRLVKANQLDQNEKVLWFVAGIGATDVNLVSLWKHELAKHSHQNIDIVEDPVSFLARALAVRALSADSSHCNLRSGEITHSRISGHSHGIHFKFALLLLVTGILLCACNIIMQRTISDSNKMMKQKIRASVDSLAGYHVSAMGSNALSIVAGSIKVREADLKPFLRAFSPSLLDVVVSIADVAKKNDLRYEGLSLSYDEISISGTSSEFNASQELVETLVSTGYLVSSKRGSAGADNRISFKITTEQQL